MFTDMVGYTTLGQRNESLALALLNEERGLIRPVLSKHNGREIKTIGDGLLVEFPNALDSVRCAYDILRKSREFNLSLPKEKRVALRIGIHLGDVVDSEGDILGDAVNIASRIQSLAEEGGVCLTQQVFDQVHNKFELPLKNMGKQTLKNVGTQIGIYQMVMPWDRTSEDSVTKIAGLDKKRIAVLPFTNISSDQNDEYFVDGMTEELISTISEISDLAVISRTSVMQFKKNTSKSVTDIGRQLNVGCLIEGSVRKAGNRVRVAVQLIEVESDKHLWVHNYDASLEDIFSIQIEIARNVADSLKVKLLATEEERMEEIPTLSAEAHDMYLRGLFFKEKSTEEGFEQAIRCFELAIEKDPVYALAYAEIASCYSSLGFFEMRPSVEAYLKAKEYSEKALSLDPRLVQAHIAISRILANSWKFADAEAELRLAVELNPNNAAAHYALSSRLYMTGKFDESISEVRVALALDPKSPGVHVMAGTVFLYAGKFDEAIQYYQTALEMNPNIALAHANLGLAYVRKGMLDMGISEIKKAIEFFHDRGPSVKNDLAYAYVKAGRIQEAKDLLSELLEMRQKDNEPRPRAAAAIAGIYSNLGEIDKSLEWLEKAYEEHSGNLIFIYNDFTYDNLRSDPRFRALLKKIGFPNAD
jgi:TolB-like protein/Tfp pilus assembly protein PilF